MPALPCLKACSLPRSYRESGHAGSGLQRVFERWKFGPSEESTQVRSTLSDGHNKPPSFVMKLVLVLKPDTLNSGRSVWPTHTAVTINWTCVRCSGKMGWRSPQGKRWPKSFVCPARTWLLTCTVPHCAYCWPVNLLAAGAAVDHLQTGVTRSGQALISSKRPEASRTVKGALDACRDMP